MYRLLVVTDNAEAKELFNGMQGWERYGFKPPRLRETTEEAIECMKRHHINAVAVDDGSFKQEMLDYLDKEYPDLPIFPIENDAEKQFDIIAKVARLLNRLYADDTNDTFDESFRMQEQRDHWMRKLMLGMETSEEHLKLQFGLYRSPEKPDSPCMMSLIGFPENDEFMSERWHYGGERLETALRNFFGRETADFRIYLTLASQQELRVLCCPKGEILNYESAEHYVQDAANHIESYLGLQLHVLQHYRLNSLKELIR